MEKDILMLVVNRNLVTLEDIDRASKFLPLYNAGFIADDEITVKFQDIFTHYAIASIYKALYKLIDILIKEAGNQPRALLEYEVIKKELESQDYYIVDEIATDFKNYIESKHWRCEGGCGNFVIKEYEPLLAPVLYPEEEEQLDIASLPEVIADIIYSFDNAEEDQDIENLKFYDYIASIYRVFSFTSFLPNKLEFSGYRDYVDGGEGIYELTTLPKTTKADNGILLKIKGLVYKRKYTGAVKSSWFGITDNTLLTQEEFTNLLLYPSFRFFNKKLKVIITEPIILDTITTLDISAKGCTITFSVEKPVEYIIDFTGFTSINASGFSFVIEGQDDTFKEPFKVDGVKLNNLMLDNIVNVKQSGEAFLYTNEDVTIGAIEFSDLPIISEDANTPEALAVYGSLNIDKEKFMTTDTKQDIIATHKYKSCQIVGATNVLVSLGEAEDAAVLAYLKKLVLEYKSPETLPPRTYNLIITDNKTNETFEVYWGAQGQDRDATLIRFGEDINDTGTASNGAWSTSLYDDTNATSSRFKFVVRDIG